MKLAMLISSGLAVSLGAAAHAANVYLLSSGDPTTDNAAAAALTAGGHTVTIGVQYIAFDGTVSLAGFQTVYVQANANWTSGYMPEAGQQQLVSWVNAGGRLVTSEWLVYYTYAGGSFGTLGSVIPAVQTFAYGSALSATYSSVTPDPAINAGLPSSFTFPLYSYTGTETYTTPKPGATEYYSTSNSAGAAGLIGWTVGSGSVFSFMSTCGPDQVNDPTFRRLFSNVMGAAAVVCYANCDSSTVAPILNIQDFSCFINRFASGESYANCDNSTVAPTLNIQDFSCFLNRFATGCR